MTADPWHSGSYTFGAAELQCAHYLSFIQTSSHNHLWSLNEQGERQYLSGRCLPIPCPRRVILVTACDSQDEHPSVSHNTHWTRRRTRQRRSAQRRQIAPRPRKRRRRAELEPEYVEQSFDQLTTRNRRRPQRRRFESRGDLAAGGVHEAGLETPREKVGAGRNEEATPERGWDALCSELRCASPKFI
jgi:hypothetical protein